MPPDRAKALLASAIRLGIFAIFMGAVVMIAVLTGLFTQVAAEFEKRPDTVREAGYALHRQLADAVPGLEVRVEDDTALVLLPLDAMNRDDTIEAWYAAMAASVEAVPGLRIEVELPLDFEPTRRARAMSLIAAPALSAGLPREAITFEDEQPPRRAADVRGVRLVLLLPE